MKSQYYLIAILLTVFVASCQKPSIDYSTMHVYSPEETQKIIDNAVKIEIAGSPLVEKRDVFQDSVTITTTTTIYKAFVSLSDDGHLVPPVDSNSTTALKISQDPIVITSSCEMVCNMSGNGQPCNITGCSETKRCGCTQGSCGNNCTTHEACHQRVGAIGFGRLIIF